MGRLALLLLLLLAALQYRLWLGEGGVRERAALERRLAVQEARNAVLAQRNQILAAEVEGLRADPEALEERARADLGFIAEGETFFLVVEGDGEAAAGDAPPAEEAR